MSKGASLCTEKWHEPAESRMEAPQWIHGCLSGYMDASVDTWKHLSGYIRKHLSGFMGRMGGSLREKKHTKTDRLLKQSVLIAEHA